MKLRIYYHQSNRKLPCHLCLSIECERMPNFQVSDGKLIIFATKFKVVEDCDETDEDYLNKFTVKSDPTLICVETAGHTSKYSFSYQGDDTYRIDLSAD